MERKMIDEEVPKSLDRKIPKFLIWTYILLPIWGIFWYYLFWNGSQGFLDKGDYWQKLQEVANTTFVEKSEKTRKE